MKRDQLNDGKVRVVRGRCDAISSSCNLVQCTLNATSNFTWVLNLALDSGVWAEFWRTICVCCVSRNIAQQSWQRPTSVIVFVVLLTKYTAYCRPHDTAQTDDCTEFCISYPMLRPKPSPVYIIRCLFTTQTEHEYKCKYQYRIKTSKNNKKKKNRQTKRQDEGVQIQVPVAKK